MQRCQQSHQGWTLIEVLVVVAIISVLLATFVVTIQTMLWQQRLFAQRNTQQRTLARLARQIRADIHAATRVEKVAIQDEEDNQQKQEHGAAICCTWPDGQSVSYQLHGDRLLRVVQSPAEKTALRQPYRLPPGAQIRLIESVDDKPVIAALEIDYLADRGVAASRSNGGARRRLVIEALIGRDLRWRDLRGKPVSVDAPGEAVP